MKTEEEILSEKINQEITEAQKVIEPLIPEDSIYNFVNTALKENRIFNFCKCMEVLSNSIIDISGDLYFIDNLSKQIDIEKERDFITSQYKASLKFNWKESLIKGKRVIKVDDEIISSQDPIKDLSKFMDKQQCCLTTVSKPIFFNNFQNCVVEVQYYCGGECAERASFIYQRDEKGNWKEIKEYDHIFA